MFQSAFYSSIHRLSGLTSHAKRHFSIMKVENPSLSNYNSFHPSLRATIPQLDALTPRFELGKDQIEILDHPAVFYSTLKDKIKNANNRIFLSSLYIGKSQSDLVDCISKTLAEKPDLKVDILLDCLRSTRDSPDPSTASLLAPLVEKYGKSRVNIRLFHTPHLYGFTKLIAPKRLNEIFGLQHMKIYGFDNEIMLSGANLSHDYFTNRQDRYYIFKSASLTNYYYRMQDAISSISYQVLPTSNHKQQYLLDWPTSNNASEPHLNVERFIKDSTRLLIPILKSRGTDNDSEEPLKDPVTLVYPVSSFAPLIRPNQSTELQGILRILSFLDEKSVKFSLTAGYFNIHPTIMSKIINAQANGQIITAAPEANSFYKSKGISYYLPAAYVYNSVKFMKELQKNHSLARIKLREWRNGTVNTENGWSYHAKGIWVSLPGESEPSITVIGSSNYTKRAYGLDLETNAIILTKDEKLKKAMAHEVDHLCEHAKIMELKDFENEDRKVSYGVQAAARILSNML